MAKSILFIDDSPSMRAIVKTLLTGRYQVFTINNCFEAINWIEEGNIPDLILTDLNMGPHDFDGYDFVETVRGSFLYGHIPVITITGESNKQKIEVIKEEFGVVKNINKPFKPLELLSSVEAALNY